jgi:hypothetical protein
MIYYKSLPSFYSDSGPSSSAVEESLPSFSEQVQEGHATVNFNEPQLAVADPETEPPPPFTPYEAEFFVDKNGNVISHDPHLNEDGKLQ